jgi:hypothetical protein
LIIVNLHRYPLDMSDRIKPYLFQRLYNLWYTSLLDYYSIIFMHWQWYVHRYLRFRYVGSVRKEPFTSLVEVAKVILTTDTVFHHNYMKAGRDRSHFRQCRSSPCWYYFLDYKFCQAQLPGKLNGADSLDGRVDDGGDPGVKRKEMNEDENTH